MSKSSLVADIERLLQRRSRVETKETSKSWVFLTEDRVYKLKKPIRDELQDLTPLRARHDNALTELDLNRRLAPDAYIGLVRVGQTGAEQLVFDEPGAKTRDWLVEMHRLPESRMLDALITNGTSKEELLEDINRLARALGNFYGEAPTTRLTASELLTVVEYQLALARDVLLHPAFEPLHVTAAEVFRRIERLWPQLESDLQKRVETGVFVEGHGDLRPEHVCLTEKPVICDCLEFNRTLRIVDPFSELSFLGLECSVLGADWIGPCLFDALEPALGERPGPFLMNVYETLHAVLRARLCLAHLLQPNPRKPAKWPPLGRWYLERAMHLLDRASLISPTTCTKAGTVETMRAPASVPPAL